MTIVCCTCGSEDVLRDAWAAWEVERQAWTLAQVFDDGFCNRCEREVSLCEQALP